MTNTKFLSLLLKEKTNSTTIQLFRYTIVGGIAFIIDFGTLSALTEYAGINYLWSAAIGFCLGVATNYIISVSWVFSNRTAKNKFVEIGGFVTIGIIGLTLNEIFIWTFTEHVGFHYQISKIITTIIVYFWNFSIRKILLFK